MGSSQFFAVFFLDYIISSFLIVGFLVAYIKLNRMQSVYQRSLVRKVNKIKERKNAYVNEKDEDKLPKLEKKHSKSVKRLEKRIKRIMRFNKNIVITNSNLVDETNLALPNQTPFTFNSKLDELINAFNESHKRHKTINAAKKGKAIIAEVETQEVVNEINVETNDETTENIIKDENTNTTPTVRNLTEEEVQEFVEVHQISVDDLLIAKENTKPAVENKPQSNLVKDIYAEQSGDDDLYTL